MAGRSIPGPGALVALTALAGALAAAVLGFLTFGAQASSQPRDVPVAVAAPAEGPLRAAAERVAAQGGDALSWQVTTPEQGRRLLADKEVYGVLELAGGPGGPSATVVLSGAVNPSGTQVAQQALTGAGQALVAALAQDGAAAPPVRVETVHPTTAAGRSAPLAVSALGWVGGLVAGALLVVLAGRAGRSVGPQRGLAHVGLTSVLVTGVLTGFLALWDSSLHLGWDTLGFLLLTVTGFATVQAGLLRLLGLRAMALLGPLYLLAPAVAAQVPQLLHPAYEALLWSWTPFRFSTEGLRSLLVGAGQAPDVATGAWVLAGLLVGGLVLLLWPRRESAGQEAEPEPADGVVDVGVDQADRLPGAQRENAAQHRHARVRR
ncbi:hypothetical protein B0I33_104261 [Prauserella shujinwangii]|uniref:Uncharacterized protein n=1 Tax=Prauserella shujinwangii TaxID=1453103 RepID=A0A2T0LWP6_9PSEU|nr:ABC transporter permease [Prauserella shujinwangii]PRX48445.1 hypothetical protein B0I33_104261 [Prauserella shujinwangii]